MSAPLRVELVEDLGGKLENFRNCWWKETLADRTMVLIDDENGEIIFCRQDFFRTKSIKVVDEFKGEKCKNNDSN